MRKIPHRGEKYQVDGEEVTVLSVGVDMVTVILANGKNGSVGKVQMNLPIIDTHEYEKI